MSYVVRDNREENGPWHEVTDVSDSGNYVTKCQHLIASVHAVVDKHENQQSVSCQNCINPPPPPKAPKPRKNRNNGKPQWRPVRNRHNEMVQSLQFAHKAIVAAIEWAQRGEELQFVDQALDQTHLGYRFLKEVLVDQGRLEGEVFEEDDEDD